MRGAPGRAVVGVGGAALALCAARAALADECLAEAPLPGLGSPDPFRAPDGEATELNAAGKTLYRDGKWEAARAQYRAASAADPEFLAPRLNVACSFVRQERFREATNEVLALVDRAYVPWGREVLEAADLGALKLRPEMAEIRRGMAGAAARWGADLDQSVLFVARQRAPLRVPASGAGVFILNPHQEVWAFVPRTGRYRQISAEDGHVLLLARSPDGARIAYVTAEKLVRGAGERDLALRGVTLHQLALASLDPGPGAHLDGDVRRLEIVAGPRGFVFRVDAEKLSGPYEIPPGDGRGGLVPWPRGARLGPTLAALTGRGVTEAAAPLTLRPGPGCVLVARETRGKDGLPALTLAVPAERRRRPVALKPAGGASLTGLPIP